MDALCTKPVMPARRKMRPAQPVVKLGAEFGDRAVAVLNYPRDETANVVEAPQLQRQIRRRAGGLNPARTEPILDLEPADRAPDTHPTRRSGVIVRWSQDQDSRRQGYPFDARGVESGGGGQRRAPAGEHYCGIESIACCHGVAGQIGPRKQLPPAPGRHSVRDPAFREPAAPRLRKADHPRPSVRIGWKRANCVEINRPRHPVSVRQLAPRP